MDLTCHCSNLLELVQPAARPEFLDHAPAERLVVEVAHREDVPVPPFLDGGHRGRRIRHRV